MALRTQVKAQVGQRDIERGEAGLLITVRGSRHTVKSPRGPSGQEENEKGEAGLLIIVRGSQHTTGGSGYL